jgi:threonine/homoserine/homoserine lactone efflux protein
MSGLVVRVAAATVGLSAALTASRDAYLALRIAGSVYLGWIGLSASRARPHGTLTGPARHAGRARRGLRHPRREDIVAGSPGCRTSD